MATLPSSNTDSATKTDRQATGAQPDNTPVGGAGTNPGPGGGVTSIATGDGITASASTGSVTLTAKVDGTTIGFDGSGQLETLGGFTNPMTTLGDMIDGGASGTPTRLAGSTTERRKWLTQTGTGSVSAAPAWAFSTIFDLNDYAAFGLDPTGATTSTAAVNAAIADLNSSTTGGVILWPAGTFKISTVLTTITNNCLMIGAGQNATVVNLPGTFKGFTFDFTSAAGQCTAAVRQMTIFGAATGSQAIYIKEINNASLSPPSQVSIQDVDLYGYWDMGIEIDNAAINNGQVGTISNVNVVASANLATGTRGLSFSGVTGVLCTNVQVFGYATHFYVSGSPNCEGIGFLKCSAVNANIGFDYNGANGWFQDCFCNVDAGPGPGSNCIGFRVNGNQCFIDNCYVLGGITTTKCYYFNGTYLKASKLLCLSTGTRFGYGIYVDNGCNTDSTISDCSLININTNAVFINSSAGDLVMDGICYNDCVGTIPINNTGGGVTITNQRGFGSNANVSALGNLVEGPWCGAKAMLQLISNQAILTGTATAISWSAISSDDSGGVFWSSGAPTVITVPGGAVKMSISVNVKFLALAAGTDMELAIADQSGNILAGTAVKQDASTSVPFLSLALIDFDLSVYTSVTSFVVSVFQNSGGGATLIGASGVGAHNCMISVTR